MKKKWMILAAAAMAGMLVLAGCTSSETENAQSVTGVQTGGGDGQSSASDNTDTSAGDQASDQSAAQDVSGTQIAGTGTTDSVSSDAAVSGDGAAPTQAGEPVEDGGPVGDVIPDEYADGDDGETEESESELTGKTTGDIWSGTYVDDDETLTVTYLDEETLSFSFQQSGISGTAELDGYQAVYKGDDHHVVVFNVNNDINTIDVTVSNEEDYDASGSPLIGTYVKEQG